MNCKEKYSKIRNIALKTVDKCLFVGAVSVITAGLYFNMLYYAKQRNKLSAKRG